MQCSRAARVSETFFSLDVSKIDLAICRCETLSRRELQLRRLT
jgi:hypothetical protein